MKIIPAILVIILAKRGGLSSWQKGNEKVDDTPERKPVIRMESKDPSGEYKVRAKVSDRNAAITFELETQLRLK